MRLAAIAALLASSVSAFTVGHGRSDPTTSSQLDMTSRRDVVGALIAGVAIGVHGESADAFSQQLDDYQWEPQQQATDGRLDLNAAFVGEYRALRGMFPSAAGKIASNGPYKQVSDIYNIPNLSDHDVQMFRQYEKFFTVNAPGRSFYERINGRVST